MTEKLDRAGAGGGPASVRQLSADVCLTCLGAGEVASERGLARCPDCDGTGQVGDHYLRTEKQLREIEQRAGRFDADAAGDVTWLINELRATRQALLQVLSAAQESEDTEKDDLLRRIRFLANEALGVYRVQPAEKS